jgi:hypothetical protein
MHFIEGVDDDKYADDVWIVSIIGSMCAVDDIRATLNVAMHAAGICSRSELACV